MICVERYKRKFSVVEVAGPDEHIGASEQEPSQAVREQRMVGRHNCDLEIRRSGLWLRGQEGDVWTCSCGKRYEKCEDEAEGGCWMLLPPNARMSDGL